MSEVKLYLGDCLSILPTLTGPVDAVITDLPYGTTACSWDVVIPFAPMWEQVKRLLKPSGAFVTTASQPFTSLLVCSNLEWFKYEWTWIKTKASNFQLSKHNPMKTHENVLVFYDEKPTYNQHTLKSGKFKNSRNSISRMTNLAYRTKQYVSRHSGYNKSVIEIPSVHNPPHPTQKPLALYEYLVLTYTDPGDTVLDFCFGSGTTGEACVRTGRNFIGCEIKPEYYAIAERRIHDAQLQIPMPLVCQ